MIETLYPHEVVIKYWDNNVYRILSTIFFICSGMYLTIFGYTKSQFSIIITCVFFILGLLYNNEDYKSRGLQ
jgi:hypothetical protein